ncbi:MAG: hypothetical protein HY903_11635 [Deltaproteobacteria bacterium]|nr:hypothetical protein [Deltaproteobacteria bacterium]
MVDRAKRKSDEAAELFEQYFESQLNQDTFRQDGQVIKLSGKEATGLEAKYNELLDKLPNTVERAHFRNRVAKLVGTYSGAPQELMTASRLAVKLDGAFQAKVAKGGVQLQAQASAPAKTNIDLSAVKTGAAAADVLEAVLGSHLGDDIKWTVKGAAPDPMAAFAGQKVRITKEETNRLKALIDELYGRLSKTEAAAFHKQASALLKQAGSAYETERKFPELAAHLSRGFEKAMR